MLCVHDVVLERPSCNKLGEKHSRTLLMNGTPCSKSCTVLLANGGRIKDLLGFHEVSTVGLAIA